MKIPSPKYGPFKRAPKPIMAILFKKAVMVRGEHIRK
jgi:hypothetical protein